MSPLPPITTIFVANLLVCRPQVGTEFVANVNLRPPPPNDAHQARRYCDVACMGVLAATHLFFLAKASDLSLQMRLNLVVNSTEHPNAVVLVQEDGFLTLQECRKREPEEARRNLCVLPS